jgi:hypothetical protein
MIDIVDVRPGEADALEIETTLGGVAVRLALRWLPRIGCWVMQVLDADGSPLGQQLAVRPGGWYPLDVRDPRCPPGDLIWSQAPDPYVRSDLGTAIVLEWYPRA